MAIKSFRDLRVWQQGMELVEQIYVLTRSFPGNEMYGLINQMRRAAVSIPSNIAEGHTRESTAEYLHFLSIAQSSLAELQTQTEISVRLKYANFESAKPTLETTESLAKQIYALRNSLKH